MVDSYQRTFANHSSRQIRVRHHEKVGEKVGENVKASSIYHQLYANMFADCFCAVNIHRLEFAKFANFKRPSHGKLKLANLSWCV